MVNKLILLVGLCLLSCNNQRSPDPLSRLQGQWRITDVKSLLVGTVNESKEEYDERINSERKCLHSSVFIYADSILAKSEGCDLLSCSIDTASIAEVTIVDDIDVEDFGENKKVSRDLIINLFGDKSTKTKNVKVIYTDCPTAYGDLGLKIILIDTQTIVLFNYYNAYFLSKKE
jgi:hypothetical protein